MPESFHYVYIIFCKICKKIYFAENLEEFIKLIDKHNVKGEYFCIDITRNIKDEDLKRKMGIKEFESLLVVEKL